MYMYVCIVTVPKEIEEKCRCVMHEAENKILMNISQMATK